jgi:hypothetical protein
MGMNAPYDPGRRGVVSLSGGRAIALTTFAPGSEDQRRDRMQRGRVADVEVEALVADGALDDGADARVDDLGAGSVHQTVGPAG